VVDNIIIKDGEEEDVGDLGITCWTCDYAPYGSSRVLTTF
jgi:hypothetical protein